MSRTLLLIIILIATYSIKTSAQPFGGHVMDGHQPGGDSTEITFFGPVPHHAPAYSITLDTTGAHLWSIGSTSKSFFTALGPIAGGIMTDTINTYPVNANDWFTLKIQTPFLNPIIGFTHRYQTTSGMDGGIVEYSFDQGANWNNVVGGCYSMVLTDTFYTSSDTLTDGTLAFSGSSNGWRVSRFQIFQGIPIKGLGCTTNWPLWIRFRFRSDANPESLDGWIISKLKIEMDNYGSGVASLSSYPSLNVYPNPVVGNYIYWPSLVSTSDLRLTIIDGTGRTIISAPYSNHTNIQSLQQGIYFYHVTDGVRHYAGRILRD